MHKFSPALVIANGKKAAALLAKREVESFLRSRGIRISASSPRLIVAVGGDGTVLFSKRHYGKPFFAIGSSTSFICQAKFSDWRKKLSLSLSRPRLEARLLLSAKIDGRPLPPALNEVGIRNPEPRVLSIHLAARQGGKSGKAARHYAFRADGVMFCTPTGSPAYCYSCGGRQMRAGEKRFQSVAISPFRRLFRPTLFPPSTVCTLRISGPERASLFIDGQEAARFTWKNSLVIRAAAAPFFFLRHAPRKKRIRGKAP